MTKTQFAEWWPILVRVALAAEGVYLPRKMGAPAGGNRKSPRGAYLMEPPGRPARGGDFGRLCLRCAMWVPELSGPDLVSPEPCARCRGRHLPHRVEPGSGHLAVRAEDLARDNWAALVEAWGNDPPWWVGTRARVRAHSGAGARRTKWGFRGGGGRLHCGRAFEPFVAGLAAAAHAWGCRQRAAAGHPFLPRYVGPWLDTVVPDLERPTARALEWVPLPAAATLEERVAWAWAELERLGEKGVARRQGGGRPRGRPASRPRRRRATSTRRTDNNGSACAKTSRRRGSSPTGTARGIFGPGPGRKPSVSTPRRTISRGWAALQRLYLARLEAGRVELNYRAGSAEVASSWEREGGGPPYPALAPVGLSA